MTPQANYFPAQKHSLLRSLGLGVGLDQSVGDVDEVVGDHTEPYPAPHTVGTPIGTALQAVTLLEQADASFAAGAPLLRVAEPPLLLMQSALFTSGAVSGNRNALDAQLLRLGFVSGGEESGIGGDQTRHPSELLLVHLQSGG